MSVQAAIDILRKRRDEIDRAIWALKQVQNDESADLEAPWDVELDNNNPRDRPVPPNGKDPDNVAAEVLSTTSKNEHIFECGCGRKFMRRGMFVRHSTVCAKAVAIPAVPRTILAVQCLDCGERFPDARSLGIHRTRTHFRGKGEAGPGFGRSAPPE